MTALIVESPVGPLTLKALHGHLVDISWGGEKRAAAGYDPVLDEAARQLEDYFAGRRTGFTVPLAPAGTPFRRRVWQAMAGIPFGSTATYGELARKVGTAARAIGGACGANPIPIIVPCHRVVASAGDGGFSGLGGLSTKRWLLEHERAVALIPPQ
jgi:methylated-DNA-[protein]-cysteine S-methyltransferase